MPPQGNLSFMVCVIAPLVIRMSGTNTGKMTCCDTGDLGKGGFVYSAGQAWAIESPNPQISKYTLLNHPAFFENDEEEQPSRGDRPVFYWCTLCLLLPGGRARKCAHPPFSGW
jgi:hypothetical protein